jgi:hypothetical protein
MSPTQDGHDEPKYDMAYMAKGQIFVPRYPIPEQPTEGLQQALNLWTRSHRYSVIIKRWKKDRNKQKKFYIALRLANLDLELYLPQRRQPGKGSGLLETDGSAV